MLIDQINLHFEFVKSVVQWGNTLEYLHSRNDVLSYVIVRLEPCAKLQEHTAKSPNVSFKA